MSKKHEVSVSDDGTRLERVYDDDEPQQRGVTVEDFFMPELIKAFKQDFRPSPSQTLQTEVFTEARLREYFHAYPQTCGDPLPLYIQELTSAGFQYKCHPLLGKAVIMADYIFV